MIEKCRCGCGRLFERGAHGRSFFGLECRNLYFGKIRAAKAAEKRVNAKCKVCAIPIVVRGSRSSHFCPKCKDARIKESKAKHRMKNVCSCGKPCTKDRCMACYMDANRAAKEAKKAEAKSARAERKRIAAEEEARRKAAQALAIARASVANLRAGAKPTTNGGAITWRECPDRSKLGACYKHGKPCFEVRTRVAACPR